MQFTGNATGQDLVADARYWADASSTDFAIADVTRSINFALDKYTGFIIGSDARWQWDDTNNTTLPIGTANLVSGQQDYSFDDTMLTIERVEVKDTSGLWVKLKAIDRKEIPLAVDEWHKDNATPRWYDKDARSVLLYPAPNYASTAGIKVYFQRAFGHFTTTGNDTKEPGFAQPYHRLLSLNAGLDYALNYKPNRVPLIEKRIDAMEKEMKKFYGKRAKDYQKKLIAKSTNAN